MILEFMGEKGYFPRTQQNRNLNNNFIRKITSYKKKLNRGENDFATIDFDLNCAKTTTIVQLQ